MDLADYWRGVISVRRLLVLVNGLPADSVVGRRYAGAGGWDLHAFLIADLFQAFTGTPHPNRPQPASESKSSRYRELRARLEAQKARLRAAPDPEPPPAETADQVVYTTRDGRTRNATRAQAAYWARGRHSP